MKLAVITAVYNESDLIDQFLRHYRDQDVDHFFVLDNYSTDGTHEIVSEERDCTVFRYGFKERLDDDEKVKSMEKVRDMIAQEYEYSVLADCDEFVYRPDMTIKELIEDEPRPLYVTAGFHMVHHTSEEEYDKNVPLILQRCYGIRDTNYDKPIVSRNNAPVKWTPGMHYALYDQCHFESDYWFKLLHYTAFDRDIAIRRRLRQIKRNTPENSMKGHGSWREGMTQEDAEKWYDGLNNSPNIEQVV